MRVQITDNLISVFAAAMFPAGVYVKRDFATGDLSAHKAISVIVQTPMITMNMLFVFLKKTIKFKLSLKLNKFRGLVV